MPVEILHDRECSMMPEISESVFSDKENEIAHYLEDTSSLRTKQ